MIYLLSVGQAAKVLNISTQAIYLKINTSMATELQEFVKEIKKGNRLIKMIEPEGIELIRLSLDNQVDEVVDNDSTSLDKDLLGVLQDTIVILQEQVLVKDLQISKLDERLEESQRITQNHQVLLQGKEKPLMLEDKSSWWDRVKVKFK